MGDRVLCSATGLAGTWGWQTAHIGPGLSDCLGTLRALSCVGLTPWSAHPSHTQWAVKRLSWPGTSRLRRLAWAQVSRQAAWPRPLWEVAHTWEVAGSCSLHTCTRMCVYTHTHSHTQPLEASAGPNKRAARALKAHVLPSYLLLQHPAGSRPVEGGCHLPPHRSGAEGRGTSSPTPLQTIPGAGTQFSKECSKVEASGGKGRGCLRWSGSSQPGGEGDNFTSLEELIVPQC